MRLEAGEDKRLLRVLFELIHRHFRESAAERSLIHEQQWDRKESILLDMESLVSQVSGVVTTLLDGSEFNALDCAGQLESTTVYEEEDLRIWLRANSQRFPVFSTYVAAVEHVRSYALLLLRR